MVDVDVTEGEFRDTSGAKGIRYMFDAAKAYIKGEAPQERKDQNAKVAM